MPSSHSLTRSFFGALGALIRHWSYKHYQLASCSTVRGQLSLGVGGGGTFSRAVTLLSAAPTADIWEDFSISETLWISSKRIKHARIDNRVVFRFLQPRSNTPTIAFLKEKRSVTQPQVAVWVGEGGRVAVICYSWSKAFNIHEWEKTEEQLNIPLSTLRQWALRFCLSDERFTFQMWLIATSHS